MTVIDRHQLREDVVEIAALTEYNRASLIPVLRKVKEKYHGLDSEALQIVADVLGIHPVEAYAVASFYAFLKPETEGQLVFRLCRTLSCDLAGKDEVVTRLQEELGIGFGETTPDELFTLEWANCMGLCDQGPAMLVNETVYTSLTPEKVSTIVADYRRQLEGEV
jgi:[NiFe] hydrogenase diaphorase moiety large subunit